MMEEQGKPYEGDIFQAGTVKEAISYLSMVLAHFGDIKIDMMVKETPK